RHRWTFARRLGVGLWPAVVDILLVRVNGVQKCALPSSNRIGKRIDLLAQGLEFCRRQIVACEAFPYLRQGSLKLSEVFCVDGREIGRASCRERVEMLVVFAYVGISVLQTCADGLDLGVY